MSDIIKEEGRKVVREVFEDYWGSVVFLLNCVKEDGLMKYEILRVVDEMVDALKNEIDMQEVYVKVGICSNFWEVYEEGEVAVGYLERDEAVVGILVDCEKERILIMVRGEWDGYKWESLIDVGRNVEAKFNLKYILKEGGRSHVCDSCKS